jgi:hypothetical protein
MYFDAVTVLIIAVIVFTSGSEERRVTRGGASFLVRAVTKSESECNISMNFINTLTADKTTAALA